MPELAALFVADPPEVWAALGFAVDDGGAVWVGGVRLQTGAAGTGLAGWVLRHLPGGPEAVTGDVDGIVTAVDDGPVEVADPVHPNGVDALDHVVVSTPALARTVAVLEAVGFDLRRVREAGGGMRQAFFRAGPAVVEVVGPADPAGAGGPARLWGLAFAAADLDATAAFLGGALGPARDAVQAGRRIATVDRSAGSSVRLAVMSAR